MPNSLDVASGHPDHVEVERTLQSRMVGHLAKAGPACAEGAKKRHYARHDGAAMPGDERRAAGTNLGSVVVAMSLTGY